MTTLTIKGRAKLIITSTRSSRKHQNKDILCKIPGSKFTFKSTNLQNVSFKAKLKIFSKNFNYNKDIETNILTNLFWSN